MAEKASKVEAAAAASESAAPAASESAAPAGATLGGPALDLVLDVPVTLSAELGSTKMRVRDVLELSQGSVIDLERGSGEPCDLMVNGRLIARGEVSLVDDRLAVRVVEVLANPDATSDPS